MNLQHLESGLVILYKCVHQIHWRVSCRTESNLRVRLKETRTFSGLLWDVLTTSRRILKVSKKVHVQPTVASVRQWSGASGQSRVTACVVVQTRQHKYLADLLEPAQREYTHLYRGICKKNATCHFGPLAGSPCSALPKAKARDFMVQPRPQSRSRNPCMLLDCRCPRFSPGYLRSGYWATIPPADASKNSRHPPPTHLPRTLTA